MRSELKNYLFEPIYKEEALMLEQSDILPSVAQLYYSKGCFTPDKGTAYLYNPVLGILSLKGLSFELF